MVDKVAHLHWLRPGRNFPNPEMKIEQKDTGEETVERRASLPSSCDSRLPLVLVFLESVSEMTQGVTPQMCAENFWTSVMRFPAALLVAVHITTRLIWKFPSRNVSFLMSFKMFGGAWSAWCSGMPEVIWMPPFGHVPLDLLLKKISSEVVDGERFFPKVGVRSNVIFAGAQVDKLSCIFCNVRSQGFDALSLLHFAESQNDRPLPAKDVPAMCMDAFDSVLLRWPPKDMNRQCDWEKHGRLSADFKYTCLSRSTNLFQLQLVRRLPAHTQIQYHGLGQVTFCALWNVCIHEANVMSTLFSIFCFRTDDENLSQSSCSDHRTRCVRTTHWLPETRTLWRNLTLRRRTNLLCSNNDSKMMLSDAWIRFRHCCNLHYSI